MDKIDVYNKLWHNLELKQFLERMEFELAMNELIFLDYDINMDIMINDCRCGYILSKEEYEKVFFDCISRKKKILEKYMIEITKLSL